MVTLDAQMGLWWQIYVDLIKVSVKYSKTEEIVMLCVKPIT